ncbi:hypothetical protein [Bacteroides salyersiae]|uniref:hypothetical protein n=1 Tax=Bacteroides salyersiae TaxID=291644 RepID=UPI0034A1AEF2
MEKETLVSKLKAKIGNPDEKGFFKNGVSERTLIAYVDAIHAGVPDDMDDAGIGEIIKVVDAMGGQMRHQVAEQVKGIAPDTKGTTTQATSTVEEKDGAMAQVLEFMRTMNQNYDDIKRRLDSSEKARSNEEYRTALIDAMKQKGAYKEAVVDIVLRGKEFDTSKKVDEVVDSYMSEYDKQYTAIFGDGDSPRQSGGQAGSQDSTVLDNFFAQKAQEGKMPKKD